MNQRSKISAAIAHCEKSDNTSQPLHFTCSDCLTAEEVVDMNKQIVTSSHSIPYYATSCATTYLWHT